MSDFLSRLKAASARLRVEQYAKPIQPKPEKERPHRPSEHRIDLYDCPAVALAKAGYNAQVTGEELEEILSRHERTKDGKLRKGWRKS